MAQNWVKIPRFRRILCLGRAMAWEEQGGRMFTGKLVQAMEEGWEEIAARLIGKIRRHPDMEVTAGRSEAELREWCQLTLENLGYWLCGGQEEEVQRRYEVASQARFEEGLPLHETVLRLHLLKDVIVDFVHEGSIPMDALHIYVEEEFDKNNARFFDAMVYHIVRAYERARRQSARYAS
jgi:hypothetical protein